MSLSAPRGTRADLVEDFTAHPVTARQVVFQGAVFDVRRDTVDLGSAGVVVRDYLLHPGAVAVLALHPFDGIDHVMLIRQYRHASRGSIWELPAGMLDVAGEPPHEAAARELAEEVDLVAEQWDVLAQHITSPGVFPEVLRVYLARGLRDVPHDDRHARHAEELTLRPLWVPLDEAVDAALAGAISNSATLVGLLSAAASRERGWSSLRPLDTPWPARDAQRDSPTWTETG